MILGNIRGIAPNKCLTNVNSFRSSEVSEHNKYNYLNLHVKYKQILSVFRCFLSWAEINEKILSLPRVYQ